MSKQTRWWGRLLAAALSVALLAGCAQEGEGLSLTVWAGGAPESLDPIYATAPGDQTILTHLYENLMRVTVDVSGNATVTNGMARGVDQEDNVDGTVTWTFRLRSAKWSNGRNVRADDFVYAWQRLADPANDSPYASLLSVVMGYDDARETGDMSLLQVSAKNDNTLTVVLNGRYDWFLTEVCTSPATSPLRRDLLEVETEEDADPAEAAPAESAESEAEEETDPWWSDPTALVTNGPYQVTEYVPGQTLTTAAWEDYYGSLPGPQTLTFRFVETAEEAQALYDAEEIDFLAELTGEMLTERMADETRPLTTELGVYSVLFNCGQNAFADVAVRQAMELVIDRTALAQAAGVTATAAEGLVPPGVPESEEGDFRTGSRALLDNDPDAYAERCTLAAETLSAAGYEGRALGTLDYMYIDQGSNAAVAEALAQMWLEHLDIHVFPRAVTEEELETALADGTFTLAAQSLQPMGNDAECYLMPWSSAGSGNVCRYANSAYDTLLSIIASAEEGAARMGCLHDAEALLLEDCVVAPLYTTGTAWELQDALTGVCRDARGWFVFSSVAVWTA